MNVDKFLQTVNKANQLKRDVLGEEGIKNLKPERDWVERVH